MFIDVHLQNILIFQIGQCVSNLWKTVIGQGGLVTVSEYFKTHESVTTDDQIQELAAQMLEQCSYIYPDEDTEVHMFYLVKNRHFVNLLCFSKTSRSETT